MFWSNHLRVDLSRCCFSYFNTRRYVKIREPSNEFVDEGGKQILQILSNNDLKNQQKGLINTNLYHLNNTTLEDKEKYNFIVLNMQSEWSVIGCHYNVVRRKRMVQNVKSGCSSTTWRNSQSNNTKSILLNDFCGVPFVLNTLLENGLMELLSL